MCSVSILYLFTIERKSPNTRSPAFIEVITGRGNRSRKGKPRIKPAVVEYLKRKGYRYNALYG